MIRVIAIFGVFMLGLSTASASETEMVDPLTGMAFVRVSAGCFTISVDAKADKSSSAKTAHSKPSLIMHNGPGTEFVHENSAIDEGDLLAADDLQTEVITNQTAQVCHNKAFWMGKFEVTQGQYEKVMGSNPSAFKRGDDYPVERVSWLDARQFVRLLNEKSGNQFRLPSESEWQYAASSGGQDVKYGAAGKAADVAWYMKNSSSTHAVGGKKPNALGLYDMSGNVWEWTADCWSEHRNNTPADGSAMSSGKCTARVLKGGSWYDAEDYIRISARLWNDTDRSDNNSGFRLVLD
ncbi:SUMF1/EgtB/PvdO family nonheme iron enzyme [Mariprofundus sp. NF]|uniref:formylglycine-generating enzyme family protein n=1 Tax=Mariprofundus sp. NF TaxID=2608716 RepID=UPI0015A1213F|nr:SUMF1/EgtB/PvdO family nonheme iron enzyme [Mariprofundus sp. NF]